MAWETPVTDRTQADVDNKTSKAYLNVDDANRLELNCMMLHEWINKLGYGTPNASFSSWQRSSFYKLKEWKAICDNLDNEKNRYAQNIQPWINVRRNVNQLSYIDVNNIERNMVVLKDRIDRNKKSFVYTGEVYCM